MPSESFGMSSAFFLARRAASTAAYSGLIVKTAYRPSAENRASRPRGTVYCAFPVTARMSSVSSPRWRFWAASGAGRARASSSVTDRRGMIVSR